MQIDSLPTREGLGKGLFPILGKVIYEKYPLVYLDNAATTQKPRQVVECISSPNKPLTYTKLPGKPCVDSSMHAARRRLSLLAERRRASISWHLASVRLS